MSTTKTVVAKTIVGASTPDLSRPSDRLPIARIDHSFVPGQPIITTGENGNNRGRDSSIDPDHGAVIRDRSSSLEGNLDTTIAETNESENESSTPRRQPNSNARDFFRSQRNNTIGNDSHIRNPITNDNQIRHVPLMDRLIVKFSLCCNLNLLRAFKTCN